MPKMLKWTVLAGLILFLGFAVSLSGQSVYSTRLDDPQAIYLGSPQFPVREWHRGRQ